MASLLSRRRSPDGGSQETNGTSPSTTVNRPRSRSGSTPTASTTAASSTAFALPEPAFKRRRIPEMAAGALMVALGALVFLWLAGGEQARSVALLASDVPQGAIITGSDLVQADISATIDVAAVDWSNISLLIGQMAITDLPARTLVTPQDVANSPDLPVGFRELGVVLKAGPMPTNDLAAADRVDVLRASGQQLDESSVVAANVTVRSLVRGDGSYFVSLIIAEEHVVEVAAAAEAGEIRLVRVP